MSTNTLASRTVARERVAPMSPAGITAFLKDRDIYQREIGDLLSDSERTIRAWAKGERDIPVAVVIMIRMAIKHGLDFADLAEFLYSAPEEELETFEEARDKLRKSSQV